MASHIYTYTDPVSLKHISQACACLQEDGLLAYPSDVNWALAWNPASKKALQKVQQLKPFHPQAQSFSLLCNSFAMIAKVGYVEQSHYRLLKKILPGPYTILLKKNHDFFKSVKDKRAAVGARYPNSRLLDALIEAFGGPLVTSSLDFAPEGKNPPTFGYEVDEFFGHGIDLILDLGEEVYPQHTTIIDCTELAPTLVRQGVGAVEGLPLCEPTS